MSNPTESKGSCLCGTISFTVKSINYNVGACHCNICRKWGGGPFMAVDCGTEVSFENAKNISIFNSSEWAERGFCNICGSHLFYRLKENNQHIMPVGLFNNDEPFIFDHQVFIEERPSYYCFANKTDNMTGAELFAKFSNSAD
jgi:hypothetical protein